MKKLCIATIVLSLFLLAVQNLTKEGTQYIKTTAGQIIDSLAVGDSLVSDYYITTPINPDVYLEGKFYMEIIAWGSADSVHLIFYKQYSDVYRNSDWVWGAKEVVEQIDSAGVYTFYEPIRGHQVVRFIVNQNPDSTYSANTWVTWALTTK